jgi:hypothetical protein
MRPDIKPGATFPDDELPDHTRTQRRLSEIQGDEPMIVTLARGHYCPTISTDEHHTSQEFRNSVGAQWPFLEGDLAPFHGWNKRTPPTPSAA